MNKYLAERGRFDAIKVFCASKMHELIGYYIYTIVLYIWVFFRLAWILGLVDTNSASLGRKPELFHGTQS